MIQEALKHIEEGAANYHAAQSPTQLTGDSIRRYVYRDDENALRTLQLERGPREIEGVTLDELASLAIDPPFGKHDDEGNAIPASDRVLTYNAHTAEVQLNPDRCEDRIIWDCNLTREFEIVRGWYHKQEAGMTMSVEEAVTLFDTYMRDSLTSLDVLKQIGTLKINSERSAEAQKDATGSLAGGLVKATADVKLPDPTITLAIKVQDDPELPRVPLKVYVRANLKTAEWVFMPVPTSFEAMIATAASNVRTRLQPAAAEGVRVMRGHLETRIYDC